MSHLPLLLSIKDLRSLTQRSEKQHIKKMKIHGDTVTPESLETNNKRRLS